MEAMKESLERNRFKLCASTFILRQRWKSSAYIMAVMALEMR